jgi:uroporphyrin-3 C-methyltransferase
VNEPTTNVPAQEKIDQAFKPLESKAGKLEATARSPSNATAIAAMLTALIALGAAAYSAFILYQQQQREDVSKVDDQIAVLQRATSEVQQRLSEVITSTESGFNRHDSSTQKLEQRIAQVLAEVKSTERTSSRDWLFAEVEYLLRLANQRVLVEKEVESAIGLLMAADDILKTAEGISAHDIRATIANDVAQLKAVGGVDVDGSFLKLGAMINQVARLKQRELSFAPPVAESRVADITPPSGWLDRLAYLIEKVWIKLGNLIDYRRGVERISPILPPEEEYYLRQNLIHKLEQAQLALLRGTQTTYQYSLDDSIKWITEYFEATDPVTISMVTAIRELQQVRVDYELPDISDSLKRVRTAMGDFHKTPSTATDGVTMDPSK